MTSEPIRRNRRRPGNPFVDTMEEEHGRVVRDLRSLQRIVRAEDADARRELVLRVDRNLRRHFALEESILFPVLLAVTSGSAGEAVALLVAEHDATRGLLDRLLAEMSAGLPGSEVLEEILRLVASHRVREEGLLYPLCAELCGEPLEALKVALDRRAREA